MDEREKEFVRTVRAHYRRSGRHTLPWRKTRNPYRILVSEIMLQQTQVDRVLPKYKSFLKQFPSVKALGDAPLGDVLRAWQGLGYNRRAKMLHECAKIITHSFRGRTPKSFAELVKLPGIGTYTAGAVMAFAYNEAVPIIETNIRTAYIHHFFADDIDIPDSECIRYIERTLDPKNPKDWYYALMDYGMYIKKTEGNLNNRSKHYTKQSTFKNSDRQIRGAILKVLSEKKISRPTLLKKLPFEKDRIDVQLYKLEEEGLIEKEGSVFKLPE